MDLDELPARPRLTLLFRLLHQAYARDVDDMLGAAGFGDIRSGQSKVFPFVPADGIQVGDLAVKAGVRKQTMAQAVDQLVTSGYLERRPNPHDRRSRLIFLTQRGEDARPVAADAGDRVERLWAEVTSSEELEALRTQLLHLLERIAHATTDEPADVRPAGSQRST